MTLSEMIKAFIGVVSVNLTSEKTLLNVLGQISSISLRQLNSSDPCMLLEISFKMIGAEREYRDTEYLICEPRVFNGLPIGLSLASADVHFQNICQGLSLV